MSLPGTQKGKNKEKAITSLLGNANDIKSEEQKSPPPQVSLETLPGGQTPQDAGAAGGPVKLASAGASWIFMLEGEAQI